MISTSRFVPRHIYVYWTQRCLCSTNALASISGEVVKDQPRSKPLYEKPKPKQQIGPVVVKPTRPAPKRLPPLPSVTDILKFYRLRAKKHMSQNFLLNPRINDRLVSVSGLKEGSYVVEVGPGPGSITRKILERNPKSLFVIEKDRRFLPMLEQLADAVTPGRMKIILGDCLDYSLTGIFPDDARIPWDDRSPNEKVAVLGNLPFSVSIPLLIKWLKQMSTKSGLFSYGRVPLTLTFQYEVAERLRAPCLSYWRYRISIMTQTFCKIEYKFKISGASFVPPPKVNIGVIRIIPLEQNYLPEGMKFEEYEKFVRCFVHYRRLPIERNMKDLFPKDKQHLIPEVFRGTSYVGSDYPLMRSVEEVAAMAKNWWNLCQENPGLLEFDYRARKAPPKILREMFDDDGLKRLRESMLSDQFKLTKEPEICLTL